MSEKKLKVKNTIKELKDDIEKLLRNIYYAENEIDQVDSDEELENVCRNIDLENGLKHIEIL